MLMSRPLPQRNMSFPGLAIAGLLQLSLVCACSRGGNPASNLDAATADDAGMLADAGTLDAARSPDSAPAYDLAVPRDATVLPDLVPASNDPSDPSSCSGPMLALASKIPAGDSVAVLGLYTMQYQQRSCTDFTGCGSWGPATPSWGPSGSGKVWLKVTGTGIITAVVDNSAGSAYGTPITNLGMDCALSGGLWDCGSYHDTEIVEGANSLKFEGHDKFSGVGLPIQGDVRANCARFFGSATGTKSAGSYKEYRGGFLLRY